jgi:hypothetical protein
MRISPLLWALFSGVLVNACAPLEPCPVPESLVRLDSEYIPAPGYATIEYTDYKVRVPPQKHFEYILSIDRKLDCKYAGLPKSGSADNDYDKRLFAVVGGPHLLHVGGCRHFFNGYYCNETVLSLEAVSETQYRIKANINKKEDYADFWIENTDSGVRVAEPIRVNGLKYLGGSELIWLLPIP